ncbi:MAG: coproporphyrinogen III oxidase [Rhizobiales bacterium]|nr:coproporphyrinogen III oxidase [Hyphomicrobiales bacterium]MBI3672432.1 coproporphyrinogen III oxidase [Hyphomicrobiales bacterium]
MTSSEAGFGVYVHWPFCKAKCPYCDFNSHVRHAPVDAMGFARSLAAELSWLAARTPARTVSSIFFGGGTPSLMPPAAVAHVLDAIASLWPVAADVETTLEANPTSIEASNFRGYRAAGVNRVSVGVQALDDADLKALGRQHSAAEALEAFRLAARIFPRVSFDMIYARPGQTLAAWRGELSRALSEQHGHMSLYQLTIEPGTAYFDLHARGALHVPGEDSATDLYDLTQQLTAKAGLAAYEVSNHAASGQESRHNLLYWRYGEYVGSGPGAHSRLVDGVNRRALVAEKHPETWAKLVAEKGTGVTDEAIVPPMEQASEYLLMGLRISQGIDLARHAALAGKAIDPDKIEALSALGLVAGDGKRLSATLAGRRVLNALIAELAV